VGVPLRVWYQSARLLSQAAGGAAGRVYTLARRARPRERREEPDVPWREPATVVEPWRGYAHMNAREVIARARQAGA
jgi:hypothetical protein